MKILDVLLCKGVHGRACEGSISLLLLIVCMFTALCAQLAVFLTGQEMRHTARNLTNRQMRILCCSAMDAVGEAEFPEGEYQLAEVKAAPSGERISLSCVGRFSSDGALYSLEFKAASSGGNERKMQRLEFIVPERLLQLASEYPLVYRSYIEGNEYLNGTNIYTSNEEVMVPQTGMLEGIGLDPGGDEQLHKKGFNSRFYYIRSSNPDNGFSFTGNDIYYGSTVFVCKGGIRIGAKSQFPDKMVFISERGNIRISGGVQMDNAIIIAKKSVIIEPGCKIKGVICADIIRINGKSEFLSDENLVARFSSKCFIS